jgi:hypothetical protein
MVVFGSIPLSLSYDFLSKTFTLQGIPLGKSLTIPILDITLNPIVGGLICAGLVIGTILTWIYRKQIIDFLKKVLRIVGRITGIQISIK